MSKQESPVNPTFARAAAIVALGKLLATKVRGDRITAAEIQESTGSDQWRRFRAPIAMWAKRNKMAARAVVNDGWRFVNATEHADEAERRRRSALRKEKESLRILVDAPLPELDDAQARRVEYLLMRAAARVANGESQDKEIKSELKLSDRVPLRSLIGGKS